MKTFKRSVAIIVLILALAGNAAIAQNTATEKERTIQKLVETQLYVFYARSLNPMSGGQRILISDYTVNVSKDSIISDLPYFGRAYSAPLNPSESGIKFTSTNFDYKLAERKKGGWNIAIQPKDVRELQNFSLAIFKNGTATLQVTSTNRQPISFNGYIREIKGNN